MTLTKLRFISAAFLFSFALSANAQTNDTPPQADTQTTISASAPEQQGWFKKTFDDALNTTENLYDNGRLSTILSGYAHHGRSTYSATQIDELNEKAWGLGVSKELRDNKDNEESIQFIVMADSHYKPQVTAGYSYQWMKPLTGNWEIGAGYVAGLISRTDIMNGIPFPGVLPVFSIGTHDTKIVASYIPRISGTGNGDVLWLALRINLK